MVVCASDGYIVDIYGPYLSGVVIFSIFNSTSSQIKKNSDAHILASMFDTDATDPESVKFLLQENDILVVDRGFRDVREVVEDDGLQLRMPALEYQQDTQSLNESRHVTKIRWVVEAVNSRIKTWKLLPMLCAITKCLMQGTTFALLQHCATNIEILSSAPTQKTWLLQSECSRKQAQ
jgi:hypothetical protein